MNLRKDLCSHSGTTFRRVLPKLRFGSSRAEPFGCLLLGATKERLPSPPPDYCQPPSSDEGERTLRKALLPLFNLLPRTRREKLCPRKKTFLSFSLSRRREKLSPRRKKLLSALILSCSSEKLQSRNKTLRTLRCRAERGTREASAPKPPLHSNYR